MKHRPHCFTLFAACWLVASFGAFELDAQTNEAEKSDSYLPKSPAAAAYILNRKSIKELIAFPRSEFVYVALLQRKGLDEKYRFEALEGLAKIRKTDRTTELVRGLTELDKKGEASVSVLVQLRPMLVRAPTNELLLKRDALIKLAVESEFPLTRQIGFASLMHADGSAEKAWAMAESDPVQLVDLLLAVFDVPEAKTREDLYPKIEPLLHKADPPEVRRAAITALSGVTGPNYEVFKKLAELIKSGTETVAIVQTLRWRPKGLWLTMETETKPIFDSLLEYLGKLPVEKRAEPDGIMVFEYASRLATSFSPEKKAEATKALRALGVNVFTIRTVPEQMLYDKTLIVVQAGKPVQLILINDDAMPHNIVVIAPDSLEKVGPLAEKMPPDADAEGRLYVPSVPEVLHATKLVEAGQQVKLSFDAPEKTGEYQYICTFPGHWRRMVGTLAVVDDVEAYLASHTAAKITEWKIADLTADIANADKNRNPSRGRELFTKLACASCHKLGAEGVNFGPDLTEVFKRYNNDRANILRQILEPSLVISNRYQNMQFDLKSDDTILGIVLKEDADGYTVQSGPSDSLIKKISKSDIASQRVSTVSIMPLGLLNTLSKEEIFDLLAYLESGGKRHEHQH